VGNGSQGTRNEFNLCDWKRKDCEVKQSGIKRKKVKNTDGKMEEKFAGIGQGKKSVGKSYTFIRIV